MKKFLIVALTVVAVLCIALGITACQHKHNYGEWIEEVAPTCTSAGVAGHYHCSDCGKDFDKEHKELSDTALAKLPHTWKDDYVVTPATCTSTGLMRRVCVVCGGTGTRKIEMEAHVFDSVVFAKAATCQAEGNIAYMHCSVCKKYYDDNGNALVENKTVEEGGWIVKKVDHVWIAGEILLAPSCSHVGFRLQTCLNCEQTQQVEMEMLAHTIQITPAVAPTCVSYGSTEEQKCSVCGLILVMSHEIPMTDHQYGAWETLLAATDDHAGIEIHTCSFCSKSETRDIAQKEHVWGAWISNSDGTHTRTCQNADCENREFTQSCVYGNGSVREATCTQGGYTVFTCQLCNYQMIGEQTEKLDHNFGDFTPDFVGVENADEHTHTHTHICKRCGFAETQDCTDTTEEVVLPTCTTGGYTKYTCKTCGSVHETNLIDAKGHSFSEWEYDATVGNAHKHTCSECSLVETQSCLFTDVVTQPNCTDGGFTTHTCSICHQVNTDTLTEALGHAFGDWVYTGGATLDSTHTHKHTCSRCQLEETKDCVMVEITQAETCTTDETITTTCKDCLVSFTNQGAQSLGHDWDKFVDDRNEEHTRECKRCHVTDTQPHVYSTATESEANCLNARVDRHTCTECGSSYTESIGAPLGHNWGAWVISETQHTRTCLREGSHVEQSSHVWTSKNLCDSCEYDALTYVLIGGHYAVYNDNRMPVSVTTVIINAQHSDPDGQNAYDVTEIYAKAFAGNKSIVSVVLPSTLTKIGEDAFNNCKSLTTVLYEGNVLTEIGSYAFANCAALENFVLPNGLATIGVMAFGNCTKYFEVDIPDSVTFIGLSAFSGTACYNDRNRWIDGVLYLGKHLIKASAEVTGDYVVKADTLTIGYVAFSECVGLTSITLPTSLNYVESNAFLGCEALASVTFLGSLNEWLGITFVNDASSPLYYAARLNIQGASGEIVIPAGVTAIPAGTFRGTEIAKVEIPDSVTFIGEEAFENCEMLTDITIPDSVKYIGANAFRNCGVFNDSSRWESGLLYIGNHLIATKPAEMSGEYTVRANTVTIGVDAFKDCVNLTKVTVASTVVRIGAHAFDGCTALKEIEFENTASRWFASRVNSISRLLSDKDLANPTMIREQFNFYDGEWKIWN